MEEITRALGEQHDELDGLLCVLTDQQWGAPVPACPGWSVADVVLHLAQTDELVLSSLDQGFAAAAAPLGGGPVDGGTVDDAVARMVDHQRGAPAPVVHARWREASAALRRALADTDPRRPMPWVVTDLPARTMATTRLSECWIHTLDVAGAVGAELPATGRLWHVARLAWRTIPYAFARAGIASPAGPVAARLTAPDGTWWEFATEDPAATTVTGSAAEFCLVAARRLDPATSGLEAEGPDAAGVLAHLRTYA